MSKSRTHPESGEAPKVLELKVAKSVIKVDGTCRVHDSVLPDLGMEEKDQLTIHFEDEAVLCTLYADDLVPKGTIKLRGEDMKRLGVSEGHKVLVGSRDDMKRHVKELKEQEKERKKEEKQQDKERKKEKKRK